MPADPTRSIWGDKKSDRRIYLIVHMLYTQQYHAQNFWMQLPIG